MEYRRGCTAYSDYSKRGTLRDVRKLLFPYPKPLLGVLPYKRNLHLSPARAHILPASDRPTNQRKCRDQSPARTLTPQPSQDWSNPWTYTLVSCRFVSTSHRSHILLLSWRLVDCVFPDLLFISDAISGRPSCSSSKVTIITSFNYATEQDGRKDQMRTSKGLPFRSQICRNASMEALYERRYLNILWTSLFYSSCSDVRDFIFKVKMLMKCRGQCLKTNVIFPEPG